jgi:DNA-binding NtrC family response regulator
MDISGPIVIIEDDEDDAQMYLSIFNELQVRNEIRIFTSGEPALIYLHDTAVKPFLIFSDINLPKLDGFAIRETIAHDIELLIKCIPYIFFTTNASAPTIIEAYKLSVQGIFQKPVSYTKWRAMIKSIVEYWSFCMVP